MIFLEECYDNYPVMPAGEALLPHIHEVNIAFSFYFHTNTALVKFDYY